MSLPNLSGKVCLVTGASRGIGRGIALQLAKSGATVYITGRKLEDLKKCAEEMKQSGGQNVLPLQADHGKEDQIKNIFETIKAEQNGQLDVLVNNAYAAVNHIKETHGKPFWEAEPAYNWDIVNNVGLRNHFICSSYAARIMTEQKSGLIVNVSSVGGLKYLFNVPYGIGKAAVDRMTEDTAVELKPHNVAVIGLRPGAVQTESLSWDDGETPNFAGKAVAHLANDTDTLMEKTGHTLPTVDLATEYKFTEDDGTVPNRHPWLAAPSL